MNYTQRIKLLRCASDSIEMQQNAGIEPVCKFDGQLSNISNRSLENFEAYEFPLTVVESKAVFKGDELYNVPNNFKFHANRVNKEGTCLWNGGEAGEVGGWIADLSWNPPKTKKILVQMDESDVQYWASFRLGRLPETSQYNSASNRFFDAVTKALEISKSAS